MRLNLTTLMQFLIGRRVVIEAMAGNRETLLVGVIFCISAALARHYDEKYLLREPWFILAPAGASILTSSILFAAMSVVGSIKARRILPGVVRAYLTFLGLYWMTAPLAWLYGIPYERFLNEVDAAQANVWTLELVSIWRVLLMSRVFSVLVPCSFLSAFSKLGTFALALFYTALIYARMPLVDWMGGVRVPPSVQPVASAYLFVMLFGFFALIAGGLTVLGSPFIAKPEWSLSAFHKVQPGGVGSGVWILALIVILVFSASLPLTQREQRLRYEVERNYKSGNIAEALTTLATHKRTEFPPQWTRHPGLSTKMVLATQNLFRLSRRYRSAGTFLSGSRPFIAKRRHCISLTIVRFPKLFLRTSGPSLEKVRLKEQKRVARIKQERRR